MGDKLMIFESRGTEFLISLYKNNYFDEKKYKEWINTHEMKEFLRHERALNRNTSKSILKREILKVLKDSSYEDMYGYFRIKRNIEQIEKDYNYINDNWEIIVNNALKRLYSIIPEWVEINPQIFLLAGGVDGGFCIFGKRIYINLIKYIGKIEEFEKVISHEMYHIRKNPFRRKKSWIKNMYFYPEKYLYELFGRILEEGIACLIQHEANFIADDPAGTLTKENMNFAEEEFKKLNEMLIFVKKGKPQYFSFQRLNAYVIGYKIAKFLYEKDGLFILNKWTLDYNYKEPIKKYIEVCRESNVNSGFTRNVEEWILYNIV
jgi:hypothetical protein